eukprot:XP_022278165.1 collagen alpha-1(I) chain-like [Canis lupus familiaris]
MTQTPGLTSRGGVCVLGILFPPGSFHRFLSSPLSESREGDRRPPHGLGAKRRSPAAAGGGGDEASGTPRARGRGGASPPARSSACGFAPGLRHRPVRQGARKRNLTRPPPAPDGGTHLPGLQGGDLAEAPEAVSPRRALGPRSGSGSRSHRLNFQGHGRRGSPVPTPAGAGGHVQQRGSTGRPLGVPPPPAFTAAGPNRPDGRGSSRPRGRPSPPPTPRSGRRRTCSAAPRPFLGPSPTAQPTPRSVRGAAAAPGPTPTAAAAGTH